MKEKLNLTNLTRMTKKDLQKTKGGVICHCACPCYAYANQTFALDSKIAVGVFFMRY